MLNNWILKRDDNDDIIELHDQFVWSDEYDWTSLVQSDPEYSITGAMDIQQGTMLAGRPISLDGDKTRTTRKDIKILQAWATVPELEMTLTHPNGDEYQVIFSRPAISTPVAGLFDYRPADHSDDDKFRVNVYLITI